MLEQVLQRYGDNLYRLALILTPDQRRAEATLLRVARSIAQLPGVQLGDAQVQQLFLAELPVERRVPARPADWATHPEPRSPEALLLNAIAQLPYEQRQALVLPLIFSTDEADIPLEQRTARRSALLTLAARADHPELPARIADLTLPELCQEARAALVLSDPALHTNPLLRGHLALCEDCRNVAHAWQHVASKTEDVLRHAMRPIRMPAAMAQQMREAATPKPPNVLRAAITSTWARRAMLPLLVILAVGALVWPRATPNPSPTAQTGAVSADMRELVRAARQTLYAVPLTGAWTQRYAMRWIFPDESFAPLVGQIWFDPETSRRRIQLTHESGGGPYELILNDGRRQLWYGTTRSYAESIFPGMVTTDRMRVLLELDKTQQEHAFETRLQSGAWALPFEYLRQAETAQLQSWGRQLAGTDLVEVVGYQGISALAGPADAPGGPADTVTVLLSIRVSDGSLREIRELIGPTGGEQASRLIWQVFDPEPLTVPAVVERVFMLSVAWNGTGRFPDEATQGARPELPLADPSTLISPASGVEYPNGVLVDFPTSLPPGISTAVVVPISNNMQALTYTGIGRSLTIVGSFDASPRNQAKFTTTGPVEQLTVAGHPTLLRRVSAAGYMLLLRPKPESVRQNLMLIYSTGYTREELLATLETLGPITLAHYETQYQLFSGSGANTEIQQIILAALKHEISPPVGQIRHTVASIYSRQQPGRDDLPDPYHYVAYGGRPAEETQERWIRPFETLQVTRYDGQVVRIQEPGSEIFATDRAPDGTLIEQYSSNPAEAIIYYGPEQQINRLPGSVFADDSEPRRTLLRLLVCGGTLYDIPPGKQITVTESFSNFSGPCMRPYYSGLVTYQQQPRWATIPPEYLPAIGDLKEQQITTVVNFGSDGKVGLINVYAGLFDGERIEGWQLIRDEVGTEPVPAEAQQAPVSTFLVDYFNASPPNMPPIYGAMTITDALQLVQTPLLALPDLNSLAKGPENPFPPDGTQLEWFGSKSGVIATPNMYTQRDWVFDYAMARGYAVQMSFDLINRTIGRQEQSIVYLGAAKQFGGFLRLRAIWQSSIPTTFRIGEQSIDGWQVFTERGTWVLGEFDGTLIAFPDSLAMRTALEQLVVVRP